MSDLRITIDFTVELEKENKSDSETLIKARVYELLSEFNRKLGFVYVRNFEVEE